MAEDQRAALRLAMVVPSLRTGIRYHAGIVRTMETAGFTVRTFTGLGPDDTCGLSLGVVPARLIRLRSRRNLYPKTLLVISPTLITEVARFRPNVIICVEYSLATVWSVVAARLTRCPVFIFQEHRFRHGDRLGPVKKAARRLLAGLANGVIANTQAAEEEVSEVLGVARRRIFRVSLLSLPELDGKGRAFPGIAEPTDRPLFLFVGQLIPRKNVNVLLDAAATLRAEGLAFSVWVVGDGPERVRLEATCRELGLEGVVSFVGEVSYAEIEGYYQACDVFVMPSFSDYRSVAVLEAMRAGKPVLDSVHDGNAHDLVRKGVNGFLFDPRRTDQLVSHMAAFIERPDLAKCMGVRSAELTKDLTAERAVAELSRLVMKP